MAFLPVAGIGSRAGANVQPAWRARWRIAQAYAIS
jgi:hypothetical protein